MGARGWLVALACVALTSSGVAQAQQGKPRDPRKDAIARSQVWRPVNTAALDLKTGPTGPGAFALGETVTCKYLDKKLSGASPKFACTLPDGEELKVKYGGTNGEVYAEVAASRLLWALGFGADRMYSVKIICRDCPSHVPGIRRENGDLIVDPAAVERKIAGRELSDEWSWEELDQVDEAAGGAPKAHRDALKLLAVMLQHSDSKPRQQRIVCVGETAGEGYDCASPMMMVSDVGITFGRANFYNLQPKGSAHLAQWSKATVWRDEPGCVGNLPSSLTGTLTNPVISEAGRQFLSNLLGRLSDAQLRDMFEAARVTLRTRVPDVGRSGFATVDDWVSAFKAKRAEIADRRCPQ